MYQSGIHISYISQTILYLIIYFLPVICFIQSCSQGIYVCVHLHFEYLFIYHSLTITHVCLMGFGHQLRLPHPMPAPSPPRKVPILVSHLLFCGAHRTSGGLHGNVRAVCCFPAWVQESVSGFMEKEKFV